MVHKENNIIEITVYCVDIHKILLKNISLTSYEKQSLTKISASKRQQEFKVSRWLRRNIIAKKLNIEPNEVIFQNNPTGKPFLKNNDYYFNLSHSGKWLFMALCKTHEIGIDIQQIQLKRNISAIAKQYFTDNEYQMLKSQPKDKQFNLFYTLWTAKEAALKTIGTGIAGGLNAYYFTLNNNQLTMKHHPEKQFICLKSYQISSDYVATIGVQTSQQHNFKITFLSIQPNATDIKKIHFSPVY